MFSNSAGTENVSKIYFVWEHRKFFEKLYSRTLKLAFMIPRLKYSGHLRKGIFHFNNFLVVHGKDYRL